jgi:carbonic anhydrase
MSSSRRTFLQLAGVAAVAELMLVSQSKAQPKSTPAPAAPPMTRPNPDEVLRKLMDGNARFVEGRTAAPRRKPEDFAALSEGQFPMAVIVGCADSRVAPELLFDQGVGDLFVIRVAGNVVDGTGAIIKGSIEYGVAELGASLVMVLGHSNCGAVKAAIKHIDAHDSLPGSINGLVNLVKPAVTKVKGKDGDTLDNAIRANVQAGVERLQTLKPILAPAVKQGKIKVVGATYDLRSGRVVMIT